jgi:hypothetical protein
MIILSLTTLVVCSLLFAPERGLLWDRWRGRRHRRTLRAGDAEAR